LPLEYSRDVRWRLNWKKLFVVGILSTKSVITVQREFGIKFLSILLPRIRSERRMNNLWKQLAPVSGRVQAWRVRGQKEAIVFCSLIREVRGSQHGRAPQLNHSELTTFLSRQLPGRWMCRGRSTSWPLRSIDLTPLPAIFPRRFVKDKVYVPPVPMNLITWRIE
jgi:hypothetical protein